MLAGFAGIEGNFLISRRLFEMKHGVPFFRLVFSAELEE